jgi:hypothetical protein
VSISAGVYHTCGLKGDGTVACWGRNDAGQATPPAGTLTAPVRSSALKLGTMWKYIYPVFQSARAPLNDHIAHYQS